MIKREDANYLAQIAKRYIDERLADIQDRSRIDAHAFEAQHMTGYNGGMPLDQKTFREFLRIVRLCGIDRIEKTGSSSTADTYTIYLTDGTSYDFEVREGRSVIGMDTEEVDEGIRLIVRMSDGEEISVVIPSGGGTWGTIKGSLSDQVDLQSALDEKANKDEVKGNFVVNITQTGSDSYNSDKTTGEIFTAYNNGNCVSLHFGGSEYRPISIVPYANVCQFSRVLTDGNGLLTEDIFGLYGTYANRTQRTITSAEGKQDQLVSGENIVTVNGQSLLGSGNIEIQGGDISDEQTSTDTTWSSEKITEKINEKLGAIDELLDIVVGGDIEGIADEILNGIGIQDGNEG